MRRDYLKLLVRVHIGASAARRMGGAKRLGKNFYHPNLDVVRFVL